MATITSRTALAAALMASLAPMLLDTTPRSRTAGPCGGPVAECAARHAGPRWPRNFDVGTNRLQIYQPQIESWDGDRIGGRAALAIGPVNGAPAYGFIHFTAQANVDKGAGW